MSLAAAGLIVLAAGVAFANGTNDISKGIATLVGSGVSNFRAAVRWGTVWTVAGGLLAALFSQGLVTTLLVGLASLSALPVSTTQVSSSAIIGIGLRRGGRGVHWTTVREMLLAWIVTLPASALLAGGAHALLSR
jgi:PiT family inorganic phosphate transporter